jgi:hypothetical protein
MFTKVKERRDEMANITIKRANTQNITLNVEPAELGPGDVVYFTVKPKFDNDSTDSAAVIAKDVTDVLVDPFTFKLTAQDTDVLPGRYVYDLTIKFVNGDRTTIADGKCRVKPVVTLRGV